MRKHSLLARSSSSLRKIRSYLHVPQAGFHSNHSGLRSVLQNRRSSASDARSDVTSPPGAIPLSDRVAGRIQRRDARQSARGAYWWAARDRLRLHGARDLREGPSPELLADLRESSALATGQLQPALVPGSENPTLGGEVFVSRYQLLVDRARDPGQRRLPVHQLCEHLVHPTFRQRYLRHGDAARGWWTVTGNDA